MSWIKLLVCCLVVGAACATDDSFAQFQEFVKVYNRQYTSLEEYVNRYFVFQENMQSAATLQQRALASGGSATFGVTKFSDMTVDEFRTRMTGFQPKADAATRRALSMTAKMDLSALPTSVDWRKKGVVSPVKDQGQCGSCWAFSATEELESAFAMNNTLTKLSVQQTVSCDTTDGGCDGGDTITAYAYITSAGGVESSSDYPYSSGGGDSGVCQFDQSKVVVQLNSWAYATKPCTGSCNNQDEKVLATTVANNGTVSICVYADDAWMSYTGGVLNDPSCTHAYSDLNHCVHLVGYDFTDSSNPYWIVRNSWNTDWGDNGYIYLQYGSNQCGLADEATIITSASKA